MQGLTASPRQALTVAQVVGLLQTNPTVLVQYGANWLSSTLGYLGDLSASMSGGSGVSSDITASIHRTLTLSIDSTAPINYLTDFVQPYMTLVDPSTGVSAQFNLGVYTMSSPQYDNSEVPSVLTVTGYDLLWFLNQPMKDSFQALAGTDPLAAVTTLIGNAAPFATTQSDVNTTTLAQDMVWPLGASDPYGGGTTTYLSAINELLASAGFLPLWVDWNGVFQARAYVSPKNQPIEYVFDMTADYNIIATARTSDQDLFDVPNYWRFIMQNLATAPVEGVSQFTYIDYDTRNPGSVTNRGRQVTKLMSVAANDYPSLVLAGMQQVALDLAPAETFNLSVSPFPAFWHRDVVFLDDPNLAVIGPQFSEVRTLICTQWSLPLDGSSDMAITLQTVTV